jgi:hypothetical protein
LDTEAICEDFYQRKMWYSESLKEEAISKLGQHHSGGSRNPEFTIRSGHRLPPV